jgi:hypothetical protein
MGLKINNALGTDQGITNEGYIRITNYNINKNGYLDFRIELFTSQAEANSFVDITNHNPILITAKNNEIGEVLIVRLTKKITTTKRVIKRVTNDETGEIVDNEVDEDTITDVADLSQLINVNIFHSLMVNYEKNYQSFLVKII